MFFCHPLFQLQPVPQSYHSLNPDPFVSGSIITSLMGDVGLVLMFGLRFIHDLQLN